MEPAFDESFPWQEFVVPPIAGECFQLPFPSPAQAAMRVKHEGESALQSAQLSKQQAEEQLAAAQAHEMSIREAQRQIASVSGGYVPLACVQLCLIQVMVEHVLSSLLCALV